MDDDAGLNSLLATRLRAALGLQQFGIDMLRQTLVRRFPAESAAEIDARLEQRLLHRPEAIDGDGIGRPTVWPRPPR